MPRHWFLNGIDLEGTRPFSEVKALVIKLILGRPSVLSPHTRLIVERKTEGGSDLLNALKLYGTTMSHSTTYVVRVGQTTWGNFPWGCVCVGCCKWTLCEHTALLTSLFRSKVVPVLWCLISWWRRRRLSARSAARSGEQPALAELVSSGRLPIRTRLRRSAMSITPCLQRLTPCLQ